MVWSLEPENFPGPHWFSICFYRLYWNTLKKYPLRMLNHGRIKKKIGGNTQYSFLALIPKEANPTNFSKFHPISLYNSSYKILTKIITNRVKPLISSFIYENQGGFMQHRYIFDNIILVQEAIHSRKVVREVGFIFIKLNMANTFDWVLPFPCFGKNRFQWTNLLFCYFQRTSTRVSVVNFALHNNG